VRRKSSRKRKNHELFENIDLEIITRRLTASDEQLLENGLEV